MKENKKSPHHAISARPITKINSKEFFHNDKFLVSLNRLKMNLLKLTKNLPSPI